MFTLFVQILHRASGGVCTEAAASGATDFRIRTKDPLGDIDHSYQYSTRSVGISEVTPRSCGEKIRVGFRDEINGNQSQAQLLYAT